MLDRPDELMHELRSPMTAILAHATALLDTWRGPPEDAERLVAIRIEAQRLLQLIARPDLGPVRRERLAPLAPAEEAVRLFAGTAADRRLALACAADGALPAWVEIDAATVRLVLANLLGNALKFTNEGGVRIAVSALPGCIRYAVTDTGIGMDADQLARLRSASIQVHASSLGRGGRGLGIASVRRLAARAGGKLDIDSLPGQGTSVRLDLPVAACGPAASAASPPGAMTEILLVGLEDDSRLAIAATLKGSGCSVTAVASLADALRIATAAAAAGRGFSAAFIAGALPGIGALADCIPRLVAVGDAASACAVQLPAVPSRQDLAAALSADHGAAAEG